MSKIIKFLFVIVQLSLGIILFEFYIKKKPKVDGLDWLMFILWALTGLYIMIT